MSGAREPLRRVMVVGDGQVGITAALAVKRALPGCEVMVMAAPGSGYANPADHASTALPFTNRLHERLGVSETDMITRAGASHRLVTSFVGWGGERQSGVAAYGSSQDRTLAQDFGRQWGGGSRSDNGNAPASLAEVLAQQNRFAVAPEGSPDQLAEVEYGLRWHQPSYRALLIERAQEAGVRYLAAGFAGADTGESGIAAVSLADGTRREADLYLDCSGAQASLHSALADAQRQDWSEYLPVRAVGFAQPGQPVAALHDRVRLEADGWVQEIAGRDGVQSCKGVAQGLPNFAPLDPAALAEPWRGNVVALGDAAARFEPLGNLNLDLAHRQVDLLLELLPAHEIAPLERAEYNRRAGLMAERVRDVLGLYYAAPAAEAVFGRQKRSDTLERWLDQYTRRGRLPFAEEAPLATGEITALMEALGIQGAAGPLARADRARQSGERAEAFARRAEAALRATPPYPQWLAQFA